MRSEKERGNTIEKAINEFGVELFQLLTKSENSLANVFMSPLSVSLALSMAEIGATDDTLSELSTTLRHTGVLQNERSLTDAISRMVHTLLHADPEVKFLIANSAWTRASENIREEYIQNVRKVFDAEVQPLSTPQAINDWCAQKTNNLISHMIDNIEPTTILMLVNAIYFKGSWTEQFDKKLTSSQPFKSGKKTATVKMMSQTRKDFFYLEEESFQMVSLDYGKTNRFAATVLLPKISEDINEFIQSSVNIENWNRWRKSLRSKKGTLYLPRIKVEYGVKSLNEELRTQGIRKAYEGGFDRIHPTIQISEVLHKAVMELDEEGTEAAAVTVVSMKKGCAMKKENPPFVMNVNHPFLFVISDKQSGLIIFLGKIVKPQ